MNDSQQYPKKLPIQRYRIKSQMDNKVKGPKPLNNRKQSLSISIDATKKRDLNKKSLGSIQNNKSFKSIKQIQQSKRKLKKISAQLNHSNQASCQTQAIQKQQKSKSLSKDIVISLQNTSKPNLQEYQQDFLLKWKAKEFITKLKKEREETNKKMQLLKLQAEQKRQAKLKQIDEKCRLQKEQQLIKRREQAKHKLEEVRFKQERRKEELMLRELHQKNINSLDQKRPRSNNFEDEKVNQLQSILEKRAKSRSDFDNLGKKEQKKAVFTRKSQVIKVERDKKVKPQPKFQINKLVPNKKESNSLQQHLYLSIDDEKMLEDIKTKLDKLQTLRSQKVSNKKSSQRKIQKLSYL